jgi:hypothetical protein
MKHMLHVHENPPSIFFYILLSVFIIAFSVSAFSPMSSGHSNNRRSESVVMQTTKILEAVKSYHAENKGKFPGGESCKSAIKHLKLSVPPYLDQNVKDINVLGNSIDTYCSDVEFIINQVASPEIATKISSGLPSTFIMNVKTGELKSVFLAF